MYCYAQRKEKEIYNIAESEPANIDILCAQ